MVTKRAGEMMVPLDNYPHIPYWFTLKQAVEMMEKPVFDIRGEKTLPRVLLVFDEKYQLLGIVRRRDILKGLEPNFLRAMTTTAGTHLFDVKVDANLVDFSVGRIQRAIIEHAEHRVSEIMQPIVSTVDYEDHAAKVVYKMVIHDLPYLPVLKDRMVVGVVRTVDVFHEFSKILK